MLEIGSYVDGKYKIMSKIGQGGMSVVYLALNERANKTWAIKEVRKDGTENKFEVVKQGLIAETEMLKRLSHPHLPSIIDVIDDEDSFLIVMDYIEGKPLSKTLREEGAQPLELVVKWAKQLCDVLGYLHSRKPPIIYRDMKPSNVMLKPDGDVTLIDFGTAREYKGGNLEDTTCLGTRGYAAPEQYGGRGETDARTDIFCLGATMYHLLTGHNPSEPPYKMYPITYWNPELSTGLEQIILKCTQENPEDRYQSCEELYYDLENYWKIDYDYINGQKKKIRLFLAAVSATLVFGIGALVFNGLIQGNKENTYNNILKIAHTNMAGGDLEKAKENYVEAVKLYPEKPDAYAQLYYDVRNISSKDYITEEEHALIEDVHHTTAHNGRFAIDLFKESNGGMTRNDDYAVYAYSLGTLYFAAYDGDGDGNITQSEFERGMDYSGSYLKSVISWGEENPSVLANGGYELSYMVDDNTQTLQLTQSGYTNSEKLHDLAVGTETSILEAGGASETDQWIKWLQLCGFEKLDLTQDVSDKEKENYRIRDNADGAIMQRNYRAFTAWLSDSEGILHTLYRGGISFDQMKNVISLMRDTLPEKSETENSLRDIIEKQLDRAEESVESLEQTYDEGMSMVTPEKQTA